MNLLIETDASIDLSSIDSGWIFVTDIDNSNGKIRLTPERVSILKINNSIAIY